MVKYDPFALDQTRLDGKQVPPWVDLGKSVLLLTLPAYETRIQSGTEIDVLTEGKELPSVGSKRSRASEALTTVESETAECTRQSGRGGVSGDHIPSGALDKIGTGLFSPPPVDDRVLCICDFIATHFTGTDIEIEAKLGTVVDLSTQLRAVLPGGATATCLEPQVNQLLRFESQVSFEAFKRLNDVLNQTVALALRHRGPVVRHTRSRHVDRRFSSGYRETRPWSRCSSGEAGTASLPNVDDAATSRMFKTRLDTLHILFPRHPYDVRVNAAREERLALSQAEELVSARGALESERHKDRLSYRWAEFSVDITVVQQPQASVITYEVELELVFDNHAERLAAMLQACADYRQRVGSASRARSGVSPPAPLLATAQIFFETLVSLNNMLVSLQTDAQTTKR
ncbi:hypothetical protein CCYA_CCYA14G3707 [Cyanidiococcus yangmingshanensis]|nr:hypothetical protein CCYA_CCYA14G3707 [Cyanidiococcus yangmingshanensis]